ncbi:MAG TPA: hypothetical protein VMO00_14165 [Methylomirabilota bacterium]|nr:hypothetical protein [Methylomirabilota bacterium]
MAEVIRAEACIKHVQLVLKNGGLRDLFQCLDFWSRKIKYLSRSALGTRQEAYGEGPFPIRRMDSPSSSALQGDDHWNNLTGTTRGTFNGTSAAFTVSVDT